MQVFPFFLLALDAQVSLLGSGRLLVKVGVIVDEVALAAFGSNGPLRWWLLVVVVGLCAVYWIEVSGMGAWWQGWLCLVQVWAEVCLAADVLVQ